MPTFEDVKQLVESKKKVFDNIDEMLSQYRGEIHHIDDYNGRQLLELLQNADDAFEDFTPTDNKDPEVAIDLDTKNKILTVKNNGRDFSIDGIRSLLYANLSSKVSSKTIGNKGLGMRAILSWAKKLKIFTSYCILTFSKQIAKDFFEDKVPDEATRNKIIRDKWGGASGDIVPVPILSVPVVEQVTSKYSNQVTFEIAYEDDKEQDIINRINDLNENILLFLNHLKKISINVDGRQTEYLSHVSEENGYKKYTINDKVFKVYTREGSIPDDLVEKDRDIIRDKYNVEIALPESFDQDASNVLYCFFPTQVKVELPFLVHGTFEIDSSRSRLLPTKINDFIFTQLAELIDVVAEKIKKEECSWRPYDMLSNWRAIENTCFQLTMLGIFNAAVVYPTISGNYVSKGNAKYFGEDFSTYLESHSKNTISNLVSPGRQGSLEICDLTDSDVRAINFYARQVGTRERTEIIEQLYRIPAEHFSNTEKLTLLEDENGDLIPSGFDAFIPSDSNEALGVDFTSLDVRIISKKQYKELANYLSKDISAITDRNNRTTKARAFVSLLKKIQQVHDPDFNDLTTTIIKQINAKVKTLDHEAACNLIRAGVKQLYRLYDGRSKNGLIPTINENMPLISRDGQVREATTLFLDMPPVREIYGELLDNSKYLYDISYWGLPEYQMKEFFKWLGVNELVELELHNNDNTVKPFFEKIVRDETHKSFNFTQFSSDNNQYIGIAQSNLGIIKRLDVTRLVLLCSVSPTMHGEVLCEQRNFNIRISSQWQVYTGKYSFILYQLGQPAKDIFIDDAPNAFTRLFNTQSIDYNYLSRFNINRSEANSILIMLGAKTDYSNIDPEAIYSKLNELARNHRAESISTIYRNALDVLRKSEKANRPVVPDDLLLYASKGDEKEFRKVSEIFYSNTKIPQNVESNFWILSLPKRYGEANVKDLFGVNILDKNAIHINDGYIRDKEASDKLNKHLAEIRRYILVARLNSKDLNSEDKKRTEASKLKKLQIVAVINAQCGFNGKDISLSSNEYVKDGTTYYLCVKGIKTDRLFKDSELSDTVADIYEDLFDVHGFFDTFRMIYRNDEEDNEHLAKYSSEELLLVADRLLGIDEAELSFWRDRYGLTIPAGSTEQREFRKLLQQHIQLPDTYDQIDFHHLDWADDSFVELLRVVSDNEHPLERLAPYGIAAFHGRLLKALSTSYINNFMNSLWNQLNGSNQGEQYIDKIENYRNAEFNDFTDKYKYVLKIDYVSLLKQWIKSKYQLEVDLSKKEQEEHGILYDGLLTEMGIEVTDLTNRQRSLLYFEGNENAISTFLDPKTSIAEQIVPVQLTDDEDSSSQEPNVIMSKVRMVAEPIVTPASVKRNGYHPLGGYSKKRAEQQQRYGRSAEQLVYEYLCEHHGIDNVNWVSAYSGSAAASDSFHYDMTCEGRYIEVKYFANDRIYMTSSEKEFADGNDKYDLYLVDSRNHINVIEAPFRDGFDNNDNFTSEVENYILHFRLGSIEQRNAEV